MLRETTSHAVREPELTTWGGWIEKDMPGSLGAAGQTIPAEMQRRELRCYFGRPAGMTLQMTPAPAAI